MKVADEDMPGPNEQVVFTWVVVDTKPGNDMYDHKIVPNRILVCGHVGQLISL